MPESELRCRVTKSPATDFALSRSYPVGPHHSQEGPSGALGTHATTMDGDDLGRPLLTDFYPAQHPSGRRGDATGHSPSAPAPRDDDDRHPGSRDSGDGDLDGDDDRSVDSYEEYEERRLRRRESVVVVVLLIVLMLGCAVERVSFKVVVDKLTDYRFFTVELVCAANVIVMAFLAILNRGSVDAEMRSMSKWKFFVMALLDTAQFLLTMLPGGIVPAPLTALLLQAAVPITLLFSATCLRRSSDYSWQHYVGALVVTVGLFVSLWPLLFNGALGQHRGEALVNCFLYAAAGVPFALSTLFKEAALSAQPVSVYYLNAWVSAMQFVIGVLLAPLAYALQRPSWSESWHHMNWSQMGRNWHDGFRCAVLNTGTDGINDCESAVVFLAIYVVVTIGVTFVIGSVAARARPQHLYAAVALAVPVAFVVLEVYASKVGMAKQFGAWDTFNWFDLSSLAVVVGGLALYNSKEEPGTLVETPYPDNPASRVALGGTMVGDDADERSDEEDGGEYGRAAGAAADAI